MTAPGPSIPITRADLDAHEMETYEPESAGIEHLDLDHISVSTDLVVEGMITLSVQGPDPTDSYGVDVDLTPETALRLAERLTATAEGRP